MNDITKKQFCEKIIGRQIIGASFDCIEQPDWCEEIKLKLDDGSVLSICAGEETGEPTLWFKDNGRKHENK